MGLRAGSGTSSRTPSCRTEGGDCAKRAFLLGSMSIGL